MSKLSDFMHRFASDTRGAIAVLFGLSLIVLLCCSAIALDTSRVYNVKAKVQAALDAAALAAAKKLDEEGATAQDVIEVATAFFDTHKSGIAMDGLVLSNFEALPDKPTSTVTTRISVRLPSIFGAVAGLDGNLDFQPISKATYKSKKIELSLVLDITGSMCDGNASPCTSGSKISALKMAAIELADSLFASNPSPQAVRVALVPYSASVNAGNLFSDVTGGIANSSNSNFTWSSWNNWNSGGGGNTCVVEREGAEAYTNATPGTGAYLSTSSTADNSRFLCPQPYIVPLADLSVAQARQNFKDSINAMIAEGGTAGHIGTAWGWYLLSPDWSSILPAESAPRAPSPDVMKVVVLMTDGEFNTSYKNGSVNSTDRTASGSSPYQALQLCDAIKNDGITVYTISFIAPASAETLLQDCSGADNHYNADTSAQLMQAFRDIVAKLTRLRITS